MRGKYDKKAARKKPKQPVVTEKPKANTATHVGNFMDIVSARALEVVAHRLPRDFRRQFANGQFNYAYDLEYMSYRVTVFVTHIDSGVKCSAGVQIDDADINDSYSWKGKARYHGSQLGDTLVRRLEDRYDPGESKEKYYKEIPPKKTREQTVEAGLKLGEQVSRQTKEKLDKIPGCAACGPSDPRFPKWEGECGHSKEEREG